MRSYIGRVRWIGSSIAVAIAFSHLASAQLPERVPIDILLPEPEETLPAGENRPQFGSAVAVRNGTALIGMATHVEGGRVAVFLPKDDSWRRAGQLPCPPSACLFVNSIVMRDNVAVVAGVVSLLVFHNEKGVWRLKEEIFQPDHVDVGRWSAGTVRYQDGFVVVGFPLPPGDIPGVVYVFELSPAGKLRRTIRLSASDAQGVDGFGISIGMARDTIVVGAADASGIEARTGAAYVFERQAGEWVQTKKLIAADGEASDGFGLTVRLNKGLLLVAAVNADRLGGASSGFEQGGIVYAFRQVNGLWTLQERFRPNPAEFLRYTDFGSDIVMFGERAIISATDPSSGESIAFEYHFPTHGFQPASFVRNPTQGGIGLFHNTLIVGSPNDSTGSGAGQAAVYDLNLPVP